MLQGKHIPDLYDLYDLAQVAGREGSRAIPRDLLQRRTCFPGFGMHCLLYIHNRSRTTIPHNSRRVSTWYMGMVDDLFIL